MAEEYEIIDIGERDITIQKYIDTKKMTDDELTKKIEEIGDRMSEISSRQCEINAELVRLKFEAEGNLSSYRSYIHDLLVRKGVAE